SIRTTSCPASVSRSAVMAPEMPIPTTSTSVSISWPSVSPLIVAVRYEIQTGLPVLRFSLRIAAGVAASIPHDLGRRGISFQPLQRLPDPACNFQVEGMVGAGHLVFAQGFGHHSGLGGEGFEIEPEG